MTHAFYIAMGLPLPLAALFPSVPGQLQAIAATLEPHLAADIMCLLDPFHCACPRMISGRACFMALGYPRWSSFIELAVGGRGRAALLDPHHFNPVYVVDGAAGRTRRGMRSDGIHTPSTVPDILLTPLGFSIMLLASCSVTGKVARRWLCDIRSVFYKMSPQNRCEVHECLYKLAPCQASVADRDPLYLVPSPQEHTDSGLDVSAHLVITTDRRIRQARVRFTFSRRH